jgi:hypothetical protein
MRFKDNQNAKQGCRSQHELHGHREPARRAWSYTGTARGIVAECLCPGGNSSFAPIGRPPLLLFMIEEHVKHSGHMQYKCDIFPTCQP